MEKGFLAAVKERRTFYGISKDITVTEDRIEEIVKEAVLYAPSAFNSQSARAVVLFGQQHDALWDITKEALRQIVSAANFAATEEKINSFRSGYGTILYFEDISVVENLQKSFPLYKDNFPIWSQQSSGMLQYIIWTALEIEGLGVSLQHYNPLIDDKVKESWNIPANWKLIAQMPFGQPTAQPGPKESQPLPERVKVYK